jgi:FOG: WD40 repeat
MNFTYFKPLNVAFIIVICTTWQYAIIAMNTTNLSLLHLNTAIPIKLIKDNLCLDLQREILYCVSNSQSAPIAWVHPSTIQCLIDKIFPSKKTVTPIAFNNNYHYMVPRDNNNTAKLISTPLNRPTFSFMQNAVTESWNNHTKLWHIIIHNEDDYTFNITLSIDSIYALQQNDPYTVKFWNNITNVDYSHTIMSIGNLQPIAFSPDGSLFLTPSRGNVAKLWDVATGLQYGPDLKHNDRITCVAFSPDGKYVLTGSADSTAKLWDVKTGLQYGPNLLHGNSVSAVKFSLDGQYALTHSYNNLGIDKLWNLSAIQHIMTLLTGYRNNNGDIIDGLNINQLEILKACSLGMQHNTIITLNQDQWHTFTTLPTDIQDALANQVQQAAPEEPTTKKQRTE